MVVAIVSATLELLSGPGAIVSFLTAVPVGLSSRACSYRAHQVLVTGVKEKSDHLKLVEDWLRSYRPEELFGHVHALRRSGSRPGRLHRMRVPQPANELSARFHRSLTGKYTTSLAPRIGFQEDPPLRAPSHGRWSLNRKAFNGESSLRQQGGTTHV